MSPQKCTALLESVVHFWGGAWLPSQKGGTFAFKSALLGTKKSASFWERSHGSLKVHFFSFGMKSHVWGPGLFVTNEKCTFYLKSMRGKGQKVHFFSTFKKCKSAKKCTVLAFASHIFWEKKFTQKVRFSLRWEFQQAEILSCWESLGHSRTFWAAPTKSGYFDHFCRCHSKSARVSKRFSEILEFSEEFPRWILRFLGISQTLAHFLSGTEKTVYTVFRCRSKSARVSKRFSESLGLNIIKTS